MVNFDFILVLLSIQNIDSTISIICKFSKKKKRKKKKKTIYIAKN